MSTYTSITISDATEKEEIAPTPVYVYGASGRCWKFKDPSKVSKYFSELKGTSNAHLYAGVNIWLKKKYGSTMLDRLNILVSSRRRGSYEGYNCEPIEHAVTITNIDGTQTLANPTRWKHTYKSINLTIYSKSQYINIADYICRPILNEDPQYAQLFNCTPVGDCLISNIKNINPLYQDYWEGDRIVYTEPRSETLVPCAAPVTQKNTSLSCHPFLRFRGTRVDPYEFTPLMIEID